MAIKIRSHTLSLKLKFILLYAVMIILLSLAMIFWVKLSFEDYVKTAEISRLSSSVIPLLKTEAKNYYTSRDETMFQSAVSGMKRANPSIIYIFITEDGEYAGGENGNNVKALIDGVNIKKGQESSVEENSLVEIGEDKQIMVSYKGELDPYMLHFTFSADVVANRMNDLVKKVSLVVAMASLVILIFGSAFLHLMVSPFEKVVKDAERLSMGDFKVKLQHGSTSEVGRIYRSLSRLKESILYSMKRLDMR